MPCCLVLSPLSVYSTSLSPDPFTLGCSLVICLVKGKVFTWCLFCVNCWLLLLPPPPLLPPPLLLLLLLLKIFLLSAIAMENIFPSAVAKENVFISAVVWMNKCLFLCCKIRFCPGRTFSCFICCQGENVGRSGRRLCTGRQLLLLLFIVCVCDTGTYHPEFVVWL